MAMRTIYLVSFRFASFQRAHFSIFVPSPARPDYGTLIHAVGAPMIGYELQFKRNYCPEQTRFPHEIVAIGQVHSSNIFDSTDTEPSTDKTPRGRIEIFAAHVPTPGISQNFMAPVNETTNKCCQEWTMEYVRYLVAKGLIGEEAIQIVQSKRDPPAFGIGLRPVRQH